MNHPTATGTRGRPATGFRSGFVALTGRPNVGKSTLANYLAGRKVAIVSEKAQTTRHRIRAIVTRPEAQVVFIDTPGLHRPLHRLGEYMVQAARKALVEVDLVAWVVDGAAGPHPADRHIAGELARVSTPVLLVVNKLDRIDRAAADALAEQYRELLPYQAYFPLSARTGEGVEKFLAGVIGRLPEGPLYYPAGTVSDQPEAFIIAELVREKVLFFTRDEVPHSTAVVVEELRSKGEVLYVRAEIYVERESQKGILIGKGGRMLRQVGEAARREVEALLGTPVFLDLYVKVRKDWREREGMLRSLGYRED